MFNYTAVSRQLFDVSHVFNAGAISSEKSKFRDCHRKLSVGQMTSLNGTSKYLLQLICMGGKEGYMYGGEGGLYVWRGRRVIFLPQVKNTLRTEVYFFLLFCGHFLILQINPIRCTILLSIFISLLYMFRATMCPSSGDNYCIYATLVFVTLYGWRLVCWLE